MFVSNSEEIGEVRKSGEENNEDKVLMASGEYATYRNFVGGLISYADRYLFAVDHDIEKRIVDNDVVITIRIKGIADKMTSQDRVLVVTGMYAPYKNLVGGLIAYAEKYMLAVDHEIKRRVVGNDVVIKIRIKDIADKLLRRRRR